MLTEIKRKLILVGSGGIGFILLLIVINVVPEGLIRLMIGLIVLFIPPCGALTWLYLWRKKEIEAFRLKYENSKKSLRKNTKSSRLREAALVACRTMLAYAMKI